MSNVSTSSWFCLIIVVSWIKCILRHLLGIPTSVSPDQNGYHWPVVKPYPLFSSTVEARGPHTRGFPIGHRESPQPITWPLTFCLRYWSVFLRSERGVCLTVDWNAAAHRSSVGLNTCCFSLLLYKELLEFYFSGKLLILSVQLNQFSALQSAWKL